MSWKVELKKSGNVFNVEDGESVLTAALRQHIGLPYGCRNGACGSCRAVLLEGSVVYGDHLPSAITVDDLPQGSVILCQARPQSDLVIEADELPVVAGLEPRILPCRVTRLERLGEDVMSMRLRLPKGQPFVYLAGQYIDILLPGGKRRSYSMAHAPGVNEDLELHVGRVEGGLFTSRVFGDMKEKELLRLNGPLGSFFIRPEIEQPIILAAGGTGYAPIQAMLEQLFAENDSRPIHFYMGARNATDLYMHHRCLDWAARYPNFHYTPVLSEPEAADQWQGATGWPQQKILEDFSDLAGFQLYMAGPPAMIHALKRTLGEAGLAQHRMFFDSFEHADA